MLEQKTVEDAYDLISWAMEDGNFKSAFQESNMAGMQIALGWVLGRNPPHRQGSQILSEAFERKFRQESP